MITSFTNKKSVFSKQLQQKNFCHINLLIGYNYYDISISQLSCMKNLSTTAAVMLAKKSEMAAKT